MRLETSLLAGREALIANGFALNTIGDDLANSTTPGYKDTRAEFADLLAGSGEGLFGNVIQTGDGVRVNGVTINHSQQGSMEATSRGLDAGIQGGGWFVLQDGDNQYYSRAGNFSTDADGFLVSATGAKVMGYTSTSPDTPSTIDVNALVGQPTASSTATISGSLNAISPIVNPLPAATSFANLNPEGTFTNVLRVVDSLGAQREVSLYFYRTGPLQYQVNAYVDGAETGGVAGTPVQVGTAQIAMGPDGKQAVASTLTLTPAWGNGAAAGNITVDMSKITAAAGSASFSNVTIDGFRGGLVKSVGFSQTGSLIATLDSGEEAEIAQLALADFKSPDGLERMGNNLFRETTESGTADIAKAGTVGRGEIVGSSLESSTVDPANEFVKMIQIQQGYKAGSQVIQAANELLTATIQIA